MLIAKVGSYSSGKSIWKCNDRSDPHIDECGCEFVNQLRAAVHEAEADSNDDVSDCETCQYFYVVCIEFQ